MNKSHVKIILIIFVFLIGLTYFQYFSYRNVSLESIQNNPVLYSNARVTLNGAIIEYEGAFFGPKYYLAEGQLLSESFDINTPKRIALAPEDSINLSKAVSYTSNGAGYTRISIKPVILKGSVVYVGTATDSPKYYLKVSDIKIDLD